MCGSHSIVQMPTRPLMTQESLCLKGGFSARSGQRVHVFNESYVPFLQTTFDAQKVPARSS